MGGKTGSDRPRERLARHGVHALSDAELVAIQLGIGTREQDVLTLSRRLITQTGGLSGLVRRDVIDLCRIPGIGPAKASRLVSAFALADRARAEEYGSVVSSSEQLAATLAPLVAGGRTERVAVLVVDGGGRSLGVATVAQGEATRCHVPIREILALVLRHDGIGFGLAHNHPSGNAEPSPEDIAVTRQLERSAHQVGLLLLDHVVLAASGWASITAAW